MVKTSLGLSTEEIKNTLILNVALTIRVAIGMLTDGMARLVYSSLLAVCSIPCFVFATAELFHSSGGAFLLGFISCRFRCRYSSCLVVPGLGTAGIYGGWGNWICSSGVYTSNSSLAFGGEDGWRYAVGITGVMSLAVLSGVLQKRPTHKSSTYFKPAQVTAMEVTSRVTFSSCIMKIPMYTPFRLCWLGNCLHQVLACCLTWRFALICKFSCTICLRNIKFGK